MEGFGAIDPYWNIPQEIKKEAPTPSIPSRPTHMQRVLVVLPHEHFARMFIETSITRQMGQDPAISFTLVTRDREDDAKLSRVGGRNVDWAPLMRPFRNPPSSVRDWPRWKAADVLAALGHYLHLSLVYRFNIQHGFTGFQNKLRQSRLRRRVSWKQGHPVRRWIGWPAPRNPHIFGWLYRFYYGRWQRHPQVRALFDRIKPDAILLATVQSPFVTPYVTEALNRGIAILGMVGSWDQPTTKGPICPGLGDLIAHSQYSASSTELIHGLPRGSVKVIGWPQMDPYQDPSILMEKDSFFTSIGLRGTSRLIVLGGYTDRLGQHEPAIAERLAVSVKEGRFGVGCTLLIRPHPADTDWAARFGWLHDPPYVLVEEPDPAHLDHLANLMKNCDVVLSSAGTLCLDSTALDTPSVGIAFSLDDNTPFYDRPERMFEMEHYSSVARTGGVRLARSFHELEAILNEYLEHPLADAGGREELRRVHLEPLDGKAGARLIETIKLFLANPVSQRLMKH